MRMNNYAAVDNRVFTPDKYVALAYGSPKGLKLQEMVENRWEQWLKIVEEASWLRNYHKVEDTKNSAPETPAGVPISNTIKYPHHHIASIIYATAVWGYGVENWATKQYSIVRDTLRKIRGLGPVEPVDNTCSWHAGVYKGCGLVIPVEFNDLDEWLEPIWLYL